MDDKKRELLQRMAAKGLYIADLQAIDEYKQRKEDEAREKEEAKNSKDVSPLINTPESNLDYDARKSRGIQDAADKWMENNKEALMKLFLGLPDVKEMNEQGKLKVRQWLDRQLSRGGAFFNELLKHYDDDLMSKFGNLRTLTEAELESLGRDLANWRHAVRGAKDIRKQELQGYSTVNAQTPATPDQMAQGVADVRNEYLADLAQGGEGRVLNRETGKFKEIFNDVPSDLPPEYVAPITLLMNLFDTSGLAPGSFSPPPSPAEKPPSDGLAQGDPDENERNRSKRVARKWLEDPIYREAHDSYFKKSMLPEDWEMGYPFVIYPPNGSSDLIVFDEDGSLPRTLAEEDDEYWKFRPLVYVPPVSDSRMKKRKRAKKGMTDVGRLGSFLSSGMFRIGE